MVGSLLHRTARRGDRMHGRGGAEQGPFHRCRPGPRDRPESDLRDYPGLYLRGTGDHALRGRFPRWARVFRMRNDRDPEVITPEEAARAVSVMEAAERSAAQSQPVVLS